MAPYRRIWGGTERYGPLPKDAGHCLFAGAVLFRSARQHADLPQQIEILRDILDRHRTVDCRQVVADLPDGAFPVDQVERLVDVVAAAAPQTARTSERW